MEDKFTIREFKKEDIDTLVEFKRRSVELNLPNSSANNVKNFKNNILRWYEKEPEGIKVVEEDGEIVAYVWLNTKKNYGLIRHLFVRKEYRRKGIAKKLFSLAEEYFNSKGKEKIRLTATLSRDWLVKFYEKMGYEKKRIIMEKSI